MKNKLAMVFSGGFSKGAAHLAIAKAFIRKGIEPDLYVGTSVGAVAAVLLASCKDADEAMGLYKSFAKNHIWPRMMAVDVFSKGGVFTAEVLARDMVRHAGIEDATFASLKDGIFKKKNISLRILNPGLADIKPFDIKAACLPAGRRPSGMDRSGKFAETILNKYDSEKAFFGKWKRTPKIGKDIKAFKIGMDGVNGWEMANADRS